MSLDVIDARISRVKFHKPSKFSPAGTPFLIAQTTTGATIKGEMSRPIEGELYRLWGEWKASKGYPDPAFEFVSFEVVVDQTVDGVSAYLSRYIRGLGPVRARAIVEAFGVDTLTTLRARPDMALQVKGITQEIVESITEHFEKNERHDPVAYAKLIELFSGHKIPRKVVDRLMVDWGSNAPGKVVERPYMLLGYPRMGWKTVDAFALAVAEYDPRGLDRQVAGLVEALERWTQQGHTFGHRVNIEEIAYGLLNGRPDPRAWEAAIGEDLVAEFVDENLSSTGDYGQPKLLSAEQEIADCLANLMHAARPLPVDLDIEGLNDDQAQAVRLIRENGVSIITGAPGTGKTFTITKVISELIDAGVRSIRLAAPTGKAAKRAAELLAKAIGGKATIDPDERSSSMLPVDIPCTTIHRALAPQPNEAAEGVPQSSAKIGRGREEFSFGRNEHHPIEAEFLVIDETSMVDVKLGSSLVRAIAPGTRVVFVGDRNQLPSVGPGSVLRDMMDGGLPTAVLTEVQRNSGRIVRACHAIKDGRVPEPAERLDLDPSVGDNWIHIEIDDPCKIAEKIVELHRSYKNFPDPVWDMQVVTPQKSRLPIACDNLNRLLSAKLNTFGNMLGEPIAGIGDGDPDAESSGFGPPFRRGDKVVRTKNGLCDLMTRIPKIPASRTGSGEPDDISSDDSIDDDDPFDFVIPDDAPRPDWHWDDDAWTLSETDIVNGDMGTILDIATTRDETFVVVEFRNPERVCRLAYAECHLSLAYALTCHKAQGSGFPYVIVPVHNSFYFDAKTGNGLFTREWIYTATSRAERMLVTVGQFSAIRAAVGRKTVHRRQTTLAARIKRALAEWSPGETTDDRGHTHLAEALS